MNFLEIAQRLRQECRMSGSGPTAVTGQTGEMKRCVDWAAEAWRIIQGDRKSWLWMRGDASVNTVAGTRSYAPKAAAPAGFGLTRWRFWWKDSFKLYRQSAGQSDESALYWMPYEDFRDYYLFGTHSNARPINFTIDPQGAILLGPAPDDVYVVSGQYQKSAQRLTANSDIPECPDDFHMAIVYRGMMFYGVSEAAQEVYDHGEREFNREMSRLEDEQLPPIDVGSDTLVE